MPNDPVRVSYTSNAVSIPSSFLASPSPSVTSCPIDFSVSPLPEYASSTAIVLANVLSPDECSRLISLAEASVPRGSSPDEQSAWRPALVSVGPGWEVPAPGYRDSDRIIWDEQTVADRIWARCAQAEGLVERLAQVADGGGGTWKLHGINPRMRFLKYSAGQYFKPHCDGPYYYSDDDGAEFCTQYTVHLYLNDSAKESPAGEGHVGGATSFLSRDQTRRLDVNPKTGSVLIFQHKGLYHEGETVERGTKYTVRMDILYKWQPLEERRMS